jgi:hypothetical protein
VKKIEFKNMTHAACSLWQHSLIGNTHDKHESFIACLCIKAGYKAAKPALGKALPPNEWARMLYPGGKAART